MPNEGKIKLAVIVPHWLGQKGGISSYYLNFVAALKKQGSFDICVITPDRLGAADVITIPAGNKIILFFQLFFTLLRQSPGVIHCADHRYLMPACALYKFFRPKVKLIFAFHTDIAGGFSFGDFFIAVAAKNCDLVFCVSRYLSDIIEKKYRIKKAIKILSTGVAIGNPDTEETEGFKLRHGLTGAYPVLCTVGVFEWGWKIEGIILLLEAFRLLDYPKKKLIIAGDGKYRRLIEEKIRALSLQDKVILTGYLDDPAPAVCCADIYCHLALREALGIAILEAMQLACPVIAVKRGGIPEIVKDNFNGLLVDPEAPQIVQAVKLILQDEELRQRLIKNGQDAVKREHDWDLAAAKFTALIKALC